MRPHRNAALATGRGGRYALPVDVQMTIAGDIASQPSRGKAPRVRELAAEYGVSESTVWNVVKRFKPAQTKKPPHKAGGSTLPAQAGASLNEGDATPPATPGATAQGHEISQ